MNICIIIDCLDFGGAERVALTLAEKLLDLGHGITLVTIDPIIKIPVDSRIKLHTLHFEKKIFKYAYNRKKMYSLLDKLQSETGAFDLILVHLYKSSRIMKFYSHPSIYHIVHSTQSKSALKDKKGYQRWRAWRKIKSVYDNLDLICVSKGVEKDLLDVMKIQPKSIQTIYNPFNIEAIRQKAEEAHTCIANQPYIIFVGRLVKEKRVDYLLDAYAASGITEDLVIVGDAEERESLENQIIALNIQARVHFTGSLSNPYPYIKNAKFLVLCSLYEGLPTVLVEALILQTAVIATNFESGPKEILPFFTMDALVEDNNNNKQLAEKMAEFSRCAPPVAIDCMESFSSEAIAHRYLALAADCSHKALKR